MKKVLKVLSASMLSAIVAVSAASVVSAVNDYEQGVLNDLAESIVLDDGTEIALPQSKINEAENYFNRDDVELDEEQAATISAAIQDAKDYIIETGVTSLGELTVDQIADIAAIAQQAADEAGLDVTVDPNGDIYPAVEDTTDPTDPADPTDPTDPADPTTPAAPSTSGTSNDGVIKTTGFEVPSVAGVAGVGILMVSAAGIYLAKASKKESVDA